MKKIKNNITNLNQQVMLLSNTVELSNDEIKALPSNPFQLVSAPGAGKFIFPIAAFGRLNTVAGRYTNIAGAAWNIIYQNDRGTSAPVFIENFLDTEGISMVNFSFPSTVLNEDYGSIGSQGIFSAFQNVPHPSFENSALHIKDILNSVTDYTGGDPANKLKIWVFYVVVDL